MADEYGASDKEKIFPAFIVLDTSWSMAEGGRLDAAEEMVPAVLDVVLGDPAVKDKLRLEVVTFSESAQILIPFGRVTDIRTVPPLTAAGGTHYGAVFGLLRTEIENAVNSLRADGYAVLRPTVFFITDGEPIDDEADRQAAFATLTDDSFKANPNVFVFGVGEATPDDLLPYKHRKGIVAISKGSAAEGLKGLIPAITQSIVSSATGAATGGGVTFDRDMLDDDDFDIYD